MSKLSYKLINKLGTNSELFTELNHDISLDENIFISSGMVYNNCEGLLYTESYTTGPNFDLYNPFHPKNMAYRASNINTVNHSFEIKYQIAEPGGSETLVNSSNNIILPANISPFADSSLTNINADPQDGTFLAYNNNSNNEYYKNIFVSGLVVMTGQLLSGAVNNGVFGLDNIPFKLNKNLTYSNTALKGNLNINHIAAKNIEISAGTIDSKTDTLNPTTKKLTSSDNISFSSNTIGNNNNSYGYSVFDKIRNTTVSDLDIINGEFNNPGNDYIVILNASVTKAKLGALTYLDSLASQFAGITINSGEVNAITNTGNRFIDFSNGLLNSFIDLKIKTQNPLYLNGGKLTANPGEIEFLVDYNTLADKNWVVGGDFYFIKIQDSVNTNDFNIFFNQKATLISTTYTWDQTVPSNAVMVFEFTDLIPDWATITTDFANYNFTLAKCHQISKNIGKLRTTDCEIRSHIKPALPRAAYINALTSGSSTIYHSYLENVSFESSVYISGIGYHEGTYMTNCLQLDTHSSYNTFYLTYLHNNESPIFSEMYNCKITGGIIHKSVLEACEVLPALSSNVYLNGCEFRDGTRVDSTVKWDNCNFYANGDVVIGSNIVNFGYFGERKTPWVTARSIYEAPLVYPDKAKQTNILSGQQSSVLGMYFSQHKIIDPADPDYTPKYDLYYEVPSIENVQTIYDPTKYMTIIDNGPMIYTPDFWSLEFPNFQKRILFGDVLNNNATLKQTIEDKLNNNLAVTTVEFPGDVDDTFYILHGNDSDLIPDDIIEDTDNDQLIWNDTNPAQNAILNAVDDNFVYIKEYYEYPLALRTARDISINVHDIVTVLPNFPDPTINIPNLNNIIKMSVNAVDNNNGASTNIAVGSYTLQFRQLGNFLDSLSNPATKIPACFIEIEQVTFVYDNGTFPVVELSNFIPTYTGSNDEYTWENIKQLSTFPTTYNIKNQSLANIPVIITGTTGDELVVTIEYWITWYWKNEDGLTLTNQISGFEGGYRSKHTISHTFITI